jgi:diadenosine tetraphosphatase ApaH/serine/threonine PP2A family protein phosphatase
MDSDFNLDSVIATLEQGDTLDEKTVVSLLRKLMEILLCEPNVLDLQSPITICGDIHGQLYDLFELFSHCGPKDSTSFLFMGDFVDRGHFSLETIFYLCALKLKYPQRFSLLRGNHECRQVNQMYGFSNECQARYGHGGVWSLCNELFDLFPVAALIDNRVFSCHGGLSPEIPGIQKISLLNRNDELPASGPLCDLCWSDPENVDGWRRNQRGAGWLFGDPQTKEFCRINGNLDFVTRSHQLAMDGFMWFFDKKLITIWSAPNYMYRSGNKASVMNYTKDNGVDSELIVFTWRPEDPAKIHEDVSIQPFFA